MVVCGALRIRIRIRILHFRMCRVCVCAVRLFFRLLMSAHPPISPSPAFPVFLQRGSGRTFGNLLAAGCWPAGSPCLNCASHELSNWNTITTYKNINKNILKKPAMLGKPIRVLWCEEVHTPNIISSVIFVKRHIIVGHWLPWLAG